MFYDHAILIQCLKSGTGVPPVSSVSSDTGGTPVPRCVDRSESIPGSRPKHVFMALNTN
jgi:hypothetical protein